MWSIAAAVPLLVWMYLLLARGDYWRVSKSFAPAAPAQVQPKHVVCVIPARDEAETIGEAVASLFEQDFPALEVIVVDDGSTDDTAEMARRAGPATVIIGKPLPAGWTGKLWALAQGIEKAETLAPDYLLFTDADIRHGRTAIAELVAIAESGDYDLVSYMVKLECGSLAQKALIPAFVYFFLQLYPPAWIRDKRRNTAAAAGGCILIRPEALRRIGGIAAIRHEIIDDCALAGAVKRSGGRVWMGLTDQSRSRRYYGSFAEIGRMISRTAFKQLRHSVLLLAGTITGLFVTYLLPPVLVFTGETIPRVLGAIAWLLISVSYVPMLRFYRRSVLWSVALPLIALFYLCVTCHSAIQYWRGRGGVWKGRVQDVRVR